MDNIIKISRFMQFICAILLLAYPVLVILYWVYAPNPIAIGSPDMNFHLSFIPPGTPILYTLDLKTKLIGFAATLIPVAVDMLLIYCLIRLFNLYKNAQIFVIDSAKYIKKTAYFLLLSQIIHPLYHATIMAIITWNNPANARYFTLHFDETNIGIILIALIIILVSWVMVEGCKLQQEQDLTV